VSSSDLPAGLPSCARFDADSPVRLAAVVPLRSALLCVVMRSVPERQRAISGLRLRRFHDPTTAAELDACAVDYGWNPICSNGYLSFVLKTEISMPPLRTDEERLALSSAKGSMQLVDE
jgi:hypothetical protein